MIVMVRMIEDASGGRPLSKTVKFTTKEVPSSASTSILQAETPMVLNS